MGSAGNRRPLLSGRAYHGTVGVIATLTVGRRQECDLRRLIPTDGRVRANMEPGNDTFYLGVPEHGISAI